MDLERLREPSTWAGLGLLFTGIGWNADQVGWFIQIVTAASGLLAVLFRERNGK